MASEELARGTNIEEVCRKLKVRVATNHRWNKQYGGTKMETVKRLKELEKDPSRAR